MELLPCGSQCHEKAAHMGGRKMELLPCGSQSHRKAAYIGGFLVVGVARFELAALRSRTVRATKLRYTPLIVIHLFYTLLYQECVFMFGSASRAHRRFCVTRPEKEVCHPSPTECRCVALSFRNPNCATPR